MFVFGATLLLFLSFALLWRWMNLRYWLKMWLGLCLQLNFSSFCWSEWDICILLHSPFRFVRNFYLYLTPCLCALQLLWSITTLRNSKVNWQFHTIFFLLHLFESWMRKQYVLHIVVAGALQWIGLMCDAEITKSSSGKKGCREESYKWEELSL